jgi:dihydrofolate synthase/folylpolyglutamate synthase
MCSTQKDTNRGSPMDAFAWLSSYDRYGWVFGLERITLLLERLGNPHLGLQVVHVAGTNGKGSVCKYIGSILQKAGYSVGMYLSPHVERFSERILVNAQEIPDEELERLIAQIKPVVEEMRQSGKPPTYFEIVTALAFVYFKKCAVDYAVVEVGLGGRFDATNVVAPLISIITNISLEHTDILGKDIASIASEKAGIVKDGVPVVTAAMGAAFDTIQQIAIERNAPVVHIDSTMWERLSLKEFIQEFAIQGSFKEYRVKTALLGKHQGENIAVAIAAVEQLQTQGVFISDNDINEGVATVTHPGRMEVISREPIVLLDGAHNPDGMRMLAKTLKEDFPSHRVILVMGVLKDKDITTMLSTIIPCADDIIVTRSENPRASDPLVLKQIIENIDRRKKIHVEESIPRALDLARRIAHPNDVICVSGSLFTVGEARRYLLSHAHTTSPSTS